MDWEAAGSEKKPKKKGRGKLILIALVVIVLIAAVGGKACSGGTQDGASEKIDWPTTGLAAMLPDPPSEYGSVSMYSTSLSATFEKMDYDDFSAYVDSCKELGFSENAAEDNTSYEADNADGHHLRVNLISDTMMVDLSMPADEDEATEGTVVEEETPVQETPTETTTEAPAQTTTAASSSNARAAIDEYEAFMNEYIDFMKTYKDSGNPVSMAIDYAKMMKRYTEMTSKFSGLDDGSLSTEDLAYYVEVQNRVNQKLADAAL